MVLVYPVAFWNPANQGGGSNPDPHANNVVLFLKGEQGQQHTYIQTTGNFTVPSVGGQATFNVSSSNWAIVNQSIEIGNAGLFTISAIPSSTQITITNRNLNGGNAAPGTLVSVGANVWTRFVDSSNSPKVIKAYGEPILTTIDSDSRSYISFTGSRNQFLQCPDSNLALGTQDFCIEYWWYQTQSSNPYIANLGIEGASSVPSVAYYLNFDLNSRTRNGAFGTQYITTPDAPATPLNQRRHFAMTRESGLIRHFYDGILAGSVNDGNINLGQGIFTVGAFLFSAFTGYSTGFKNYIRLTKGIPRYTTNFNPETDTYLS
jgi:hypothetical protein